jgi:hypothetical protein
MENLLQSVLADSGFAIPAGAVTGFTIGMRGGIKGALIGLLLGWALGGIISMIADPSDDADRAAREIVNERIEAAKAEYEGTINSISENIVSTEEGLRRFSNMDRAGIELTETEAAQRRQLTTNLGNYQRELQATIVKMNSMVAEGSTVFSANEDWRTSPTAYGAAPVLYQINVGESGAGKNDATDLLLSSLGLDTKEGILKNLSSDILGQGTEGIANAIREMSAVSVPDGIFSLQSAMPRGSLMGPNGEGIEFDPDDNLYVLASTNPSRDALARGLEALNEKLDVLAMAIETYRPATFANTISVENSRAAMKDMLQSPRRG